MAKERALHVRRFPGRWTKRHWLAVALLIVLAFVVWHAGRVPFVAHAAQGSVGAAPSKAAAITEVSTFRAGWEAVCDRDYCADALLAREIVETAPNTQYVLTLTLTLDHKVSAGDVGLATAVVKIGEPDPVLVEPRAYKLSGRSATTTTLQWSDRVTTDARGELTVLSGLSVRDRNGDDFARTTGTRGVLRVELTPP